MARVLAPSIRLAALSLPRGNGKSWPAGYLASEALRPGGHSSRPGGSFASRRHGGGFPMRIRLCPRGGGPASTVATLAPVNRSGRGVTQAPLRADGRTSRPDTRSGLNLVDRTHDPVNRAFKEPAPFGERALSRNVRTDTPAASPRSEARSRPTTQHLPDEGYGCEVCRDTGYRPNTANTVTRCDCWKTNPIILARQAERKRR